MPLRHYFRLMDTQARMALRASASRYYLGYLWWLLEPLLWVGVFYVVFNMILDSRRADFLVFLMCGKLTFIWFSKAVTQASNSIVANRGLIAKIDIPKSLFPMATVQENLYKQLAVFALLFATLWVSGYAVSAAWVWLLPLIAVNYLMIVACALIGACLVCMARDFSMFIPLGMTFLLFTSGIFWDVRDLGDPAKTDLVLAVNPLAFVLDAYRQILMYQTPPDAGHLLLIGLVSAVIVIGMAWVMRRGSQFLALKALTA
ncbi:ABC transporter permease [Parahaliea mediterranea]|uniref:Transport permease protein n=2 Tax=Parahaliea mediterranea TaxID=651086 RepID=A0A939IN86_9GAMM|nr:ABC transporter permease [Parahaliea mediterranea]